MNIKSIINSAIKLKNFFPVLTFILGYTLEPYISNKLGTNIESDKQTFEKRIQGYVYFTEGLGLQDKINYLEECKLNPSNSGCPNIIDLDKNLYEAIQSKNTAYSQGRLRIALLSDSGVVKSLAYYSENYLGHQDKCYNYSKYKADIAIYQAMRNELKRGDDPIDDETMVTVIFGCKLEQNP